MKTRLSSRLLMVLVMFFGTLSAASAADRFFAEAVNFEPGETKSIAFSLENTQEFFGFQADISLPEGLEIMTVNGKADCTLSSRVNSSYSIVSNLLSENSVRIGAFSTSHTPISGNSGALLYLNVHASDSFVGGTLSITDILFTNASNNDVALPDYTVEIGNTHNDRFYIPDFKIAVGETKVISLILDNESHFTAFQTDIYLPEGLTIVSHSPVMTSRGDNHSISAMAFSDGRVRLACLSLNNATFTGNSGALVNLQITATKDVAEACQIELKNQRFSLPNATEYILPNSVTDVTTERALVESITLSQSSISMVTGETFQLSATVLPTFASTKDLEWSTADASIASVSDSGLVSAIAPGSTTITAAAVDGSGVKATCEVLVTGVPVSAITLNRETAELKVTETLQLSATVEPANAYDKSLTWSSSDESIATVDANGMVTAVKEGNVEIKATSVSNPDVSATCAVTVIPTPVSSIELNLTNVSLEVGESTQLEALVLPETATVKDINWRSDDESIATVENGLVTAVSLGSTSIMAQAADGSGISAICNVKVVPTSATGISIITPDVTSFKVGETIQLSATVTPENATDKSVAWSVSDDAIASVSVTGLVKALSVGEVTVTATNSAGNTDKIALTVIPTLAENITVTPASSTIRVGQELTLIASVEPSTTTDKNMSWSSSAPDIVSVDEVGTVTAISLGTVEITASATDGSGVKATARITVEPTPATGIAIAYEGKKELYVGEKVQLGAVVSPEDATDKSVIWETQVAEILSVDETGLVTAVGLGEAWIGATNSAGQSDYIVFTVVPTPVTSITLNSESVTLKATETYELKASVLPIDATDKSMVYSSTDTTVATVSPEGVITAIAVGQAEITVTAKDGSGVSATCMVNVVPTPVESISITAEGPTTLKATQTVQLYAEVLPETATDKNVTWSSSDDAVASVNDEGLVTANSVGTAIISASAGSMSAQISITVEKTLAESITLNRSTAEMKVAGTMQLIATFVPQSTTDKTVAWSSSNENIASVNADGLVCANALGECVITATATDGSGVSATCTVNVGETAAESISITPRGPFTVYAGETTQLTATVLPETTSDKSVTWMAENECVTVDENGLVTAISVGECKVIATNSAGQTDEVKFIVIPTKVEAITLDTPSIELKATETYQLTAIVSPADATDRTLSWTSQNPEIATVDKNGVVTAVSVGHTEITVSANDGSGVSTTCEVNVVATPVESVSITAEGSTTLKATQTLQLHAEVLPETATDKNVTWSSSDDAVASVNDEGLVTANTVGSVTISASAGNKSAELMIIVDPTLAESLILNSQTSDLKVGEELQLIATILPSTTTNQAVTWSSSNEDIASVSDSGVVTAKNLGSAIITASTSDGTNLTAQCNITVVPTPVERIEIIYDGPTTLKVGETAQLAYRIYPENATDKSVEWMSQTSAFTVTQEGLVTAVGLCEENWIGVFTPSIDSPDQKSDIVYFKCIPTPVEQITLTTENNAIKVGETTQIIATVSPETATEKTLAWSSNNESIATVNQNGEVTGVSVGEVDINARATDGSDISAALRIIVIPTPVESLEIIANGSTQLKDGESVSLIASISPASATDQSVTWNSDNELIATVDEDGLVTAHSELGTAIISATSHNGISASVEIEVIETPVESITINYIGNSTEILDGESLAVSADVFPATATNPAVEWSVSDPSILSYQEGTVRALAPGEAYVIATASNGVSASLLITVKPILIERIEFTSQLAIPLYGEDGEKTQVKMEPKIYPENASIKTLHWTSSNESVAIILDDNIFEAVGAGQTTLTCYSEDGSNVSATCEVKVIIPLTDVYLNEHEITLEKNQTFELIAQIEPIDVTDYALNWASSDASIASVDNGIVEAHSAGECTIDVFASSELGSTCQDTCLVTVKGSNDGICSISLDDVEVKIENSKIIIENLASGKTAAIYSVAGDCLMRERSIGENIIFDVAGNEVYIVKCGNVALKLIVP